MLNRLRQITFLAALAVTAGLGMAEAAGSPDDAIKARQEEMKANSKAMGALVSILKGETPYDAAKVKSSVDAIAAAGAAADSASAWDAAAQTGTIETWAKPEVWTDAAGFDAARQKLSTALAALSATNDAGAFKSAFPQLGGACKGCHETYRRPKD